MEEIAIAKKALMKLNRLLSEYDRRRTTLAGLQINPIIFSSRENVEFIPDTPISDTPEISGIYTVKKMIEINALPDWRIDIWCRNTKLNKNGVIIGTDDIQKILTEKLSSKDMKRTAGDFARYLVEIIPLCFKCKMIKHDGTEVTFEEILD